MKREPRDDHIGSSSEGTLSSPSVDRLFTLLLREVRVKTR